MVFLTSFHQDEFWSSISLWLVSFSGYVSCVPSKGESSMFHTPSLHSAHWLVCHRCKESTVLLDMVDTSSCPLPSVCSCGNSGLGRLRVGTKTTVSCKAGISIDYGLNTLGTLPNSINICWFVGRFILMSKWPVLWLVHYICRDLKLFHEVVTAINNFGL